MDTVYIWNMSLLSYLCSVYTPERVAIYMILDST